MIFDGGRDISRSDATDFCVMTKVSKNIFAAHNELACTSSSQTSHLSQRRFTALLLRSVAPPLPTRNASLVSCGNPMEAGSMRQGTHRTNIIPPQKISAQTTPCVSNGGASRKGAFSSFCRLTKRGRSRRSEISPVHFSLSHGRPTAVQGDMKRRLHIVAI